MSEIRHTRAVDVEYVRVARDEAEPSPLLRMLDWPLSPTAGEKVVSDISRLQFRTQPMLNVPPYTHLLEVVEGSPGPAPLA